MEFNNFTKDLKNSDPFVILTYTHLNFKVMEKYTIASLENHYEMTINIDQIALRTIQRLKENHPEVLEFKKESDYYDCFINKDTVAIQYVSNWEDLSEIPAQFNIPFTVWCKGENSIYEYIVSEWNKKYALAPEPAVIANPRDIWEYISTLKPYSNRWRYTIDLAAEYTKKGANPSDFMDEIIENVAYKLLEY